MTALRRSHTSDTWRQYRQKQGWRETLGTRLHLLLVELEKMAEIVTRCTKKKYGLNGQTTAKQLSKNNNNTTLQVIAILLIKEDLLN